MKRDMHSELMHVRQVPRAYAVAFIIAAVLAVVIAFAAFRGSGDAPAQASITDADAAGAGSFAISPPESLADLSAHAQIVVMGTIGRQLETHRVLLGQSSPLGEQGRTFAPTIDIVSYELHIDRYLTGSGGTTITLQHPVNINAEGVDAAAPAAGETGMFFLSPADEWKLGGYASYFGRYGRLIERNGAVVYAGADAQQPAFARDTSLAEFAAAIR